jgi:general secretion pathway protein J
MNRAGAHDSGMTLLEMLISLFLIALIATAGSGMLLQTLRAARVVEARGTDARALEAALAMIRHDLEAFTGRAARTGIPSEDAVAFDGRASGSGGRLFAFVRNGWADPGGLSARSDLQRVEYAFERGALIRRSWRAPDPAPGTPVAELRLLEGLESFTVRYGRRDAWRGDWVNAAGPDRVPDKVELTFGFAGDDVLTARFRLGLRE